MFPKKVKSIVSLMVSAMLILNSSIPIMGFPEIVSGTNSETNMVENYKDPVLTSSVNSFNDQVNLFSVTDSVSDNAWDHLSYSGMQATLFKADDGKYYAVKGMKFRAGQGASSSDPKVLKINKKGIIKAGKSGSATLTSEKYGNVEVNIISPSLSDKKASLTVGDSKQLTLSNVPDGVPVAWQSSNQNVVQVLSGNCVAVGIGKSKVSAYVGGKPFTCNITVKDKSNSTLLFNVGTVPVTIKGIKKVTFDISDNAVAIRKNKISGSAPAKIPVSGNVSDGHKMRIYLNDYSLETSVSLKIGEKKCILPEMTHEFPVLKSKDNSIAAISEYGVVIGQSSGTTVLSGKYGGEES